MSRRLRRLWRRYCREYVYLYRLTRGDLWTGAVFMPGSRIYGELAELRRDLAEFTGEPPRRLRRLLAKAGVR